jgi:chorismate-pyruvate lyase
MSSGYEWTERRAFVDGERRQRDLHERDRRATTGARARANGQPGVAVPPADLDPFDRMLLSADGTVTTLLEACTGEAIATRTTRQAGPATLDALLAATGGWWHPDPRLLELAPADGLIARRALLHGARSDIAYLLAESLVAPDRLPTPLAERLTREGASIGCLLTGWSLETRREVLEITAIRAGDVSDHLGVGPGETLARRTYRIVIRQRTAILVTEWLAPGRLAAAALAHDCDTTHPAGAPRATARTTRDHLEA